jgi:acyl carrier protein phosphodiesterase
MNWLAHVYLSEPDVEHRLGNILADVVKGRDRKRLPPGIRRGIACHQVIDGFTDYHPQVMACKAFFSPDYRPYAGIVLDIYFDHLLAVNWRIYSEVELPDFLTELYHSFLSYPGELPELVRHLLRRLTAEDWFGSYRFVEGVEDVLKRVSRRLKRPVALERALPELRHNHAAVETAFHAFFPQLCEHVRTQDKTADSHKLP